MKKIMTSDPDANKITFLSLFSPVGICYVFIARSSLAMKCVGAKQIEVVLSFSMNQIVREYFTLPTVHNFAGSFLIFKFQIKVYPESGKFSRFFSE